MSDPTSATSIIASQTNTTTPINVKKKWGRPKGSKDKVEGLSLKRRLKVLEEIILDPKHEQKTHDRLTAIKTLSDLLNDKVRTPEEGGTKTVIRFEDDKVKEVVEKVENIVKEIPINTTTTTTILGGIKTDENIQVVPIQPLKEEEKEKIIELHFNIDENNKKDEF